MELVLPVSYSVIEQEEMTYFEGGKIRCFASLI